MVLAVDKNFVNATFQQQISDGKYVLNLDDKAKIIGCWNGLAKRILNDEEGDDTEDKTPMKRAVAFCRTIEDSEKIVKLFAKNINDYQKLNPEDETVLQCELQHVDGKQNALQRNERLEWLKAEPLHSPPSQAGG